MRINAVQISLSDISKRRIARSSCGCELSPSSLDQGICNKHDEKPEPGGKTLVLTLDKIWHHVKQKRQRFRIWKAPDRGSRHLLALERRHRDQAASNQIVQCPAQWDVKLHRTPSLPAAPVVWTCRAHIDDCLANPGNGGSHQGSVCQVWVNGDPGGHISLFGRKSASLRVPGSWSL
jgi:hypothetical protein